MQHEYVEACGCKFEKELSQLLRISGIAVCSLTIVIEFAST